MRELRGCEGIVNLVDFFAYPQTFYVVLDLAKGGDVFDRLSKRTVYNECVARNLAINLLNTIEFMHSKGIAHRDLKPENLLLVDKDDDAVLKVGDFGFAKKVDPKGLTTRCGTPAFVVSLILHLLHISRFQIFIFTHTDIEIYFHPQAPEVVLGVPYNEMADMWSVGAIIFFLLGGYPPFQADSHKELFRKIRAADYVFHEKYWGKISIQAKQIISLLLTVDPKERLSASEALKHDWLDLNSRVLRCNDLHKSVTGFKSFCARRKLKGAALAVSYAVSARFWNSQYVTFEHLSSSENMYEGIPASKLFKNNFMLGKKIKGGTFSTVWEATCMVTKKRFAVKIVSRKNLTKNDDAQVLNEVAILQSLKHKSIVQLIDFFEEGEKFYLVMEILEGGDVFDRIVQRSHYTEKDARDLARALLEAVEFLHSHNVAHRDLKPQNLLLTVRN